MAISNLSTIDLILLGLLRNQPMSPYDLTKLSGLFELVKISTPAVYKNIRRLKAEGFLRSSSSKAGNMPEKKIYSLTKSGEKKFMELMAQSSSSAVEFYFDFNVPLLFVASVDKRYGKEIINQVQTSLREKRKYLSEQIKKYQDLPFPVVNLANQHLRLNEILLKWIKEFNEEFEAHQT